MMPEEKIAEWKRLADATARDEAGAWFVMAGEHQAHADEPEWIIANGNGAVAIELHKEDADSICAAREALPALIRALAGHAEMIAALRKAAYWLPLVEAKLGAAEQLAEDREFIHAVLAKSRPSGRQQS